MVEFIRTKNKEEALHPDNPDGLYFPTDDTSIIMGGKEYGISDITASDNFVIDNTLYVDGEVIDDTLYIKGEVIDDVLYLK